MSYWNMYPDYVTVAEKKAKASSVLKKLLKKGKHIEPVIIDGRKIAKQWWGKSWNENLERYADYSNRIGRGRAYVRNGMVVDLKIVKGSINSLVAGTRASPYKTKIKIDTLSKGQWNKIIKQTEGQIDSIQTLLEGRFPRDFTSLFMKKGTGLFPSPKEIHFECSCPDWAYMCKHIAATLYAIGARLDSKPELFFILRGVNMEDLAVKLIEKEKNKILKASKKKSKRQLDISEDKLSELFGVSMDAGFNKLPDESVDKKKKKVKKRKASERKVTGSKKTKKKTMKRQAERQKDVKKKISGKKVTGSKETKKKLAKQKSAKTYTEKRKNLKKIVKKGVLSGKRLKKTDRQRKSLLKRKKKQNSVE